VFAGLLQQFSGQVTNLANVANSIQQSLIAASRVFEVLDTPSEIVSPTGGASLPKARGEVEFRHVTFGYDPAAPVLNDVNLHVTPGMCVAVLGATGSGKTTLMSLVPRFYDPQGGQVLVDGLDVRTMDLDDLRRNVGVVFQESFLFSMSVARNIAFGHPQATPEQIERAAHVAAAHRFIRDLPNGYDTVLREAGADLSGGQRQRLAIARAILLEPAILLLDDPTAAIDPQTEEEIMTAMESAMLGRTTFVIAHRLSTLKRADMVVVLEAGRIVQCGTHEQLMAAAGPYRRAARLQVADDVSLKLLQMNESIEG
jgi:ATP-binding cassette subfamily B protein